MSANRRTLQRLATRQEISNTATRLFLDRGFDQVTVDEIAAAAKVGRMTVFNHFPRKEDMFFDRTDEVSAMLGHVLEQRPNDVSPVEALQQAAHKLIAENSRFVEFSEASRGFVDAITSSESLLTRLRGIRGEIAKLLAVALAACAGQDSDDVAAEFASSLLVATWTVALNHGHRVFAETNEKTKAEAAFLAIVDRGTKGLKAALEGTPYA